MPLNFYNLSPTQRILKWRELRASLTNKDEFNQLLATAEFWADAPLQTFVLDWDQIEKWPTAWELLYEGNFDTNVVAILMEQTLVLSGWDNARFKLMYIKDTKIEAQMMTLLVDDKWILNYSLREVFDYTRIKHHCLTYIKYQILQNKRIEI